MSLFDPPDESAGIPEPPGVAADDDRAALAAIAAAVEVCWPRAEVLPVQGDAQGLAWRFSGRWWRDPVALHRDRSSARR